ncbi:restriction endonuclease [Luteimonas vadosa]|uniref:Restriction endonuclease type IV Mrr domain-containing protein n=1 Tax=Luteimonas vadosa TaxID=1165507 RepID=A0ABP9E273_9GAMM
MSSALPWIVALVITVLIGSAATFYIRTIMLRRNEAKAGITALSAMSWREFIHLVLEALQRRGYETIVDEDAPSSSSEYLLAKDGQRWLMSCKHGSAFVLGPAAVGELAKELKLSSATNGMIVTQGRVSEDARGPAKMMKIELLDGPTLWPQIREVLPREQIDRISASAGKDVRKHVLLAWLGALATGVLALFLMPEPVSSPGTAGQTVAATPAAAEAHATPVAGPTPGETPATVPAATDEATLDRQREEVAKAIGTLPMVDRAIWPTKSTLEVLLTDTSVDAIAAICPLIERYEGLAASRIQLTPPPGSEAPVRFRQCRMF